MYKKIIKYLGMTSTWLGIFSVFSLMNVIKTNEDWVSHLPPMIASFFLIFFDENPSE